MLVKSAIESGDEVRISFSYSNMMRYQEGSFVYHFPPFDAAEEAKVRFKADVNVSGKLSNYTCNLDNRSDVNGSFSLNDRTPRSLNDGVRISFKLDNSKTCYVADSGHGFIAWNEKNKELISEFGRPLANYKKVEVPGRLINSLVAHNEICERIRRGENVDDITAMARRYKLLTPLTSFLAVDALK